MKKSLLILSILILVVLGIGCNLTTDWQQSKLDATASADIYHTEATREANYEKLQATKEAHIVGLEATLEAQRIQVQKLQAEIQLESERADSYVKKSNADLMTYQTKAQLEIQKKLIDDLLKTNKRLSRQVQTMNFLNGLSAVVLAVIFGIVFYYLFKPERNR